MSTTPITARLNALKSKMTEFTVVEVKTPVPSADILELFRANSAARSDSSNDWTIDVFPNMTPILMYVMLMSIRHSNATQHREHSKASVATICMYHMSLVYGFFLLNDLHVRPAPSAHARSWAETSWKLDFTNFLINVPMPEFLSTILSQFHAFETDRSKNVFFIPSAAGYDHDQFFGRVYPLNMFAAIHDCTATLPGNSSKTDVLRDLYSRILYTISEPSFTCVIPDLIGVTIDRTTPTTANHMNSKLFQVFNSVINPVLFRDFQRRSTLAALHFKAPTYDNPHVNAYDMLFSATSANLRELKVVMQSISAVLADAVPCKQTLGQFITANSSDSIIQHGYSTYALPTWSHSDSTTKVTSLGAVTTYNLVSEEERAVDFSFLQRPSAEIPHTHEVTDVIYASTEAPTDPLPLPTGHRLSRSYPLSLRHDSAQTNGFPRHNNRDLVKFNDELHTVPSVLVLDTAGDQTVTAHLALLTGKIIESFELDGTTIEMPNALKSLGMQNCQFADSAIPYRYVQPGSSFHPRPAGEVLPPLNRVPPDSTPRLPAASLLCDRTRIYLPRFNTRIFEDVMPAVLPGMTAIRVANVVRYVQSFLGFRTVSAASNAAANDAIPAMSEARLLLWSPYTYTPYESDDYPTPSLGESRHYYLTNLRTFFGTNYNLVQTKHPYESLPVV